MWTNGNIYFFTLLSINILDLILVTLSIIVQSSAGSYVILFLSPISAILNCHFLLDLYETNIRIEHGGSTLSQSHPDLSLHFTGFNSGSEGTDTPEDSPFLSSFSGPIQPFHDDSMEPYPADGEPEAEPSLPVMTLEATSPVADTEVGRGSI
ncbi:hypothetical protein C2E23DRAFT_341287 [Lenzites betulinus]|nr:hypothetical protein C2E23DRAFT_341287 [Lenzites betulinus]